MQVIRDEQLGGLFMIPLLVDWRISELCQIELPDGALCPGRTTTIIVLEPDETPDGQAMRFGICEAHHQAAHAADRFDYTLHPGMRMAARGQTQEVSNGTGNG